MLDSCVVCTKERGGERKSERGMAEEDRRPTERRKGGRLRERRRRERLVR